MAITLFSIANFLVQLLSSQTQPHKVSRFRCCGRFRLKRWRKKQSVGWKCKNIEVEIFQFFNLVYIGSVCGKSNWKADHFESVAENTLLK